MNFLTLFQNPNPGLDHYCIAIEGFKPDSVMEELKRQGLTPSRPSGSDQVYFPDPDGLTVLLQERVPSDSTTRLGLRTSRWGVYCGEGGCRNGNSG